MAGRRRQPCLLAAGALSLAVATCARWALADPPPTTVPSGFTGASAGQSHFGTGTAPWGTPAANAGTAGPTTRPAQSVSFFGVDASAETVVYLCDASGSMVSVFGQVKVELKRSVDGLTIDENGAQRFNVIFFHDSGADALFKDGPQLATLDDKAKAHDFIDGYVSVGGTDPLPAIKLALDEKPKQVFLLTDGFDQIADLNTVVDPFKRADMTTRVDCLFLKSDNDPKLVDALNRIAILRHGTVRTIAKKDM